MECPSLKEFYHSVHIVHAPDPSFTCCIYIYIFIYIYISMTSEISCRLATLFTVLFPCWLYIEYRLGKACFASRWGAVIVGTIFNTWNWGFVQSYYMLKFGLRLVKFDKNAAMLRAQSCLPFSLKWITSLLKYMGAWGIASNSLTGSLRAPLFLK